MEKSERKKIRYLKLNEINRNAHPAAKTECLCSRHFSTSFASSMKMEISNAIAFNEWRWHLYGMSYVRWCIVRVSVPFIDVCMCVRSLCMQHRYVIQEFSVPFKEVRTYRVWEVQYVIAEFTCERVRVRMRVYVCEWKEKCHNPHYSTAYCCFTIAALLLLLLLLTFVVDVIVCSCGFEQICNLYPFVCKKKNNIKMHNQIELLNIMDMQQYITTENREQSVRVF